MFPTGSTTWRDARGAIGHARSDDLIHWDVLPPLVGPGDFGHMEVPQLTEINGRYNLLFCAGADVHSSHRHQRTGLEPITGTHYRVADHSLGPFRFVAAEFLAGDEIGSLYAGKLVRGPDGGWLFLTSEETYEPAD